MTRRGLRLRCELVGWAGEELRAGRYARALSLLLASLRGDLS